MRPHFGALGVVLAKKALQKNVQKKVTPPDGNEGSSPRQEAPGQAATIKDCSNKKQLFGHMLKQLFEFLSEMWIELKIEFKIEHLFRKCGLN